MRIAIFHVNREMDCVRLKYCESTEESKMNKALKGIDENLIRLSEDRLKEMGEIVIKDMKLISSGSRSAAKCPLILNARIIINALMLSNTLLLSSFVSIGPAFFECSIIFSDNFCGDTGFQKAVSSNSNKSLFRGGQSFLAQAALAVAGLFSLENKDFQELSTELGFSK